MASPLLALEPVPKEARAISLSVAEVAASAKERALMDALHGTAGMAPRE